MNARLSRRYVRKRADVAIYLGRSATRDDQIKIPLRQIHSFFRAQLQFMHSLKFRHSECLWSLHSLND